MKKPADGLHESNQKTYNNSLVYTRLIMSKNKR